MLRICHEQNTAATASMPSASADNPFALLPQPSKFEIVLIRKNPACRGARDVQRSRRGGARCGQLRGGNCLEALAVRTQQTAGSAAAWFPDSPAERPATATNRGKEWIELAFESCRVLTEPEFPRNRLRSGCERLTGIRHRSRRRRKNCFAIGRRLAINQRARNQVERLHRLSGNETCECAYPGSGESTEHTAPVVVTSRGAKDSPNATGNCPCANDDFGVPPILVHPNADDIGMVQPKTSLAQPRYALVAEQIVSGCAGEPAVKRRTSSPCDRDFILAGKIANAAPFAHAGFCRFRIFW